jgi:hypothetical protein
MKKNEKTAENRRVENFIPQISFRKFEERSKVIIW